MRLFNRILSTTTILICVLTSPLVLSQGTYWGMTSSGGSSGGGTIYTVNESGTFTKRYDFQRIAGGSPKGEVIKATNGKYYGVTELGGTNGVGVLFSYDPGTEVYEVLVNFTSSTSGASAIGALPYRGPIQAANGRLYGTCTSGGANGFGTIWEYNISTSTIAKRHDFNGTNGREPRGRLVQLASGLMYGTTRIGGANNAGVIFSVSSTGTSFTKRHDFGPAADGIQPITGLTLASNGILYGTTFVGGSGNSGTLYSLNPSGNVFTKLYDMLLADGTRPQGELLQASNGLIYGTTTLGGTFNQGTVFSWTINSATYTKRADFGPSVGNNALGRLITANNGLLYGMTAGGGVNNAGAIFTFNTTTNALTQSTALGNSGLSNPWGGLIEDPNGTFVGMTLNGGDGGSGALFKYVPATNTVTSLVDFNFSPGNKPLGTLTRSADGLFYGYTNVGGLQNEGVIFSFDPNTDTYERLFDLGGTNGGFPIGGGLVEVNGKLYGLCSTGGSLNGGTLFEFTPSTSTYTVRANLGGALGAAPKAGLLRASNGKLYGTTTAGGLQNNGTLFDFDPSNNTFTKRVDLTISDGSEAIAEMMQADNGLLYGTCSEGGQFSQGTLYVFNTSTNTFTKLYNFSSIQGGNPSGQLVQAGNGRLYGTNREDGLFFSGNIWSWNIATNTYTEEFDFNATPNGSGSESGLVLGSDGRLYGTCREGGASNLGSVFRLNPVDNNFNLLQSLNNTTGSLPFAGLARETVPTSGGVQLAAKVFLQGPYVAGQMDDDLRFLPGFPLTEPYTAAAGFTHVGNGGGEAIAPAVLSVGGSNAIVDWVFIELRDKANSSTVLQTRSALVQRDGDVVDTDGTSPVTINTAADDYFVAIRHRNHLGVMTLSAQALGASPLSLNLTNGSVATFGTEAQALDGATRLMWTGNAQPDAVLKYTGSANDRDAILDRIGGTVPTATVSGYFPEDVNLDGVVKYTGLANDRDFILQNIGGAAPTAIRNQQLP